MKSPVQNFVNVRDGIWLHLKGVVTEVRDQHKISCSEALKKVEGLSETVSCGRMPMDGSLVFHLPLSAITNQEVFVVNKESLLAFIFDMGYGTQENKSRFDITRTTRMPMYECSS